MHSGTECSFKKTDKITRLDGIILQMKQDYAVVFLLKRRKKHLIFAFYSFQISQKSPIFEKNHDRTPKKAEKSFADSASRRNFALAIQNQDNCTCKNSQGQRTAKRLNAWPPKQNLLTRRNKNGEVAELVDALL